MTLIKVLKKIYFLFFSRFIHRKIKIYDRHKTYEDYINKQLEKMKQHQKRVNYTINKHTIDRFKIVADKDMRKMSNIV